MSGKLVWTHSPPTKPGWYFFRHAGITPRVVHFYRNGYQTTALHADQSYLFPAGAILSFAGPIAEPEEPEPFPLPPLIHPIALPEGPE